MRKEAGLVEAPKGFVWENGVLVPATKAAGKGMTARSASSRTERIEEAVMSRFVVNSHSLRALQQAVLGLAVELENGSQAMGPYGYSSRPDPATNYSTQIADYGVLNGGDEALGEFFAAWQQSLAVIGKNIEALSSSSAPPPTPTRPPSRPQFAGRALPVHARSQPLPPPPKGLGGLITGG